MKVIYQLINFVLLFGILGFVLRNYIPAVFRIHREQIRKDLEEAEEAKRKAASVHEDIREMHREGEKTRDRILIKADHQAEINHNLLVQEGLHEAREMINNIYADEDGLRKAMSERVNMDLVKRIAQMTGEVIARGEFTEQQRALNKQFIEQSRDMIKVMPSDELRMKLGKNIRISVISAIPFETEDMHHFADIMEEKFGDQISWRFADDPDYLGGVNLKVDDTIYDATIRHQLDMMIANMEAGLDLEFDEQKTVRENILLQLERMSHAVDIYQVGEVISLGDGICRVSGLSDCMAGELLQFPDGLKGMVQDLDETNVGVILLGPVNHLEEGMRVRRTGHVIEVPVGEELLGRVVNALGEPIDGLGVLSTDQRRPIEMPAPAVIDRQPVNVPMQTGLKAIDALVPIGRGQRELIIGDRQTGKTAIALDAIINQKGKNVICIYVAIGQKESTVANVVERLRMAEALEYTIVVSANASEPAPLLYIAPYAGASMGEYFMYSGRDVLIVYDDLSKQATAYRELSLLLQRPPGREAYPGDVFYLHSRLLERSARLSEASGGGSMTALPIVETQAGDISAYIPTNVISITDGQIFLESDLFHAGNRPAVNVGLSVSRVGGSAQLKAMKQVAGRMRIDLAQYRELASFAQFGSDLDQATQRQLRRGEHMTEVLKQDQFRPMSAADQIIILAACTMGLTDDIPLEKMKRLEESLIPYVHDSIPALRANVLSGRKLEEKEIAELQEVITGFCRSFK